MREIKFRGKKVNGSGWIYGMPNYQMTHIFNDSQVDSADNYEVVPETIGQYLYTQNNIEVYDGDILRVNEYENLYFKLKGEDYENTNINDYSLTDVKGQLIDSYVSNVYCESNIDFLLRCGEFSELMASQLYEDQKRCSTICEFELLGNIHDNPELLTKN